MDRSLNEAARDIGRVIEQLREAMRDKGYPFAHVELSVWANHGTAWFVIRLNAEDADAFPSPIGFSLDRRACTGSTLGEAYTKADAAIAAMPDRAAERAAS